MTLTAEPPRPRLSTPRALARLLPFAKPVLPRLILGAVSALVASLLALTIPLVLQAIVAGPIASGDPAQLVWGSVVILVLGLLEALMVWARRWFVLAPATKVEYDLRVGFYSRLQRLPVAFHDRWQSGQLLSRMMQDISLIRRWLAFGIVLLLVNLITITVGSVILFRWHWLLGTIFVLSSAPLWYSAYRFEKTYGSLARQSQDQAGDLATSVEESVHGIRVLKAFGRGKHALEKFTHQAETLRQTELNKAGAVGWIWFWLVLLPDIAFALCLGAGIVLVQLGQLQVAELVAFFAMATVLRWPMESIGFLFSFLLDARTATDRIFEVFDEENTIVDPAEPGDDPAATRRARVRRRALPVSGCRAPRAGSSRRHRPRAAAGRDHGARRPHGLGQDDPHDTPVSPLRRHRGRVTVDGVDVRDIELNELRRHVGMAFEDATLFSQIGARQRAARARGPGRRKPRGRGRAARSARHRAGGLRRRPARRRGHDGRRGGPEPLGRPATASRARPRGRGEPRGARARRPAVGARRRHRGPRGGGPARRARRDDRAHRRPPAVDRRSRRPRGAARGRPHHGGGPHSELLRESDHYRHVILESRGREARRFALFDTNPMALTRNWR